MTPPSGENVHFVDTELQVLLQALDEFAQVTVLHTIFDISRMGFMVDGLLKASLE